MQHPSSRLITGSDLHTSKAVSHWLSFSWWWFPPICRPCVKTFNPANDAPFTTCCYLFPLLEPEIYRETSQSALSCRRSTKWGANVHEMNANTCQIWGFLCLFLWNFGVWPTEKLSQSLFCLSWHRSKIWPQIWPSSLGYPGPRCSVYMEQLTNAQWGNNRSLTWTGRRMSKAEVLLCKQTDAGGQPIWSSLMIFY